MQKLQAVVSEASFRLQGIIRKVGAFNLYAFLLLIVMTIAYNAQIWRMGYYYDDWEGVFLQKQLFSFRQIWEYFLIDRPFSSIIHFIYNPILGASPIGWRILGQLLNWMAILLLVKTLLNIWPKRVMENAWIGLLLAVYPGITRQFVIRTSMPHYTSMFLFTLSLLLMVKAATNTSQRKLYTSLSIGLGLLQVLIIEYFSGLEIIRLLLLLYIFRKGSLTIIEAARKAILTWLPYVIIFGIFIIFRMSILPAIQMEGMTAKNQTEIFAQIQEDPIGVIFQYAEIIWQDTIYSVFYVWSQIIVPEEFDFQAKATLISWLLGIAVASICAVSVGIWHRAAVVDEKKEPFPFLVFILCITAMLLGGLPVWLVGRQAIIGIWASRYLFGPVMGAVPLLVIFIIWLTGQPRRRVQSIFFAALLAGAIAFQFRLANKYALNWQYQRDYYWQLKWRAPSLETGTFILSPYTPFAYNADYEIAFAINILYAPGNDNNQVRYWWFDGPDDIIDFDTGQYPSMKEINHTFRSLSFQSNMQHSLPVLYRPARGCLQVVDRRYQDAPGLLPEEQLLFPAANIDLVRDEVISFSDDVFGKEPDHNWCFFFQKGDLASQQQRWESIISLWDEAKNLGFKPSYGPEYLPFLEASLHMGHWEQAIQITEAANQTEKMAPFLCSAWSRIVDDIPASPEKQGAWVAIKNEYKCGN